MCRITCVLLEDGTKKNEKKEDAGSVIWMHAKV
jgi:hypothetical protein